MNGTVTPGMPSTQSPTRVTCSYADHNGSMALNAVRCDGPLEVTHDSRGCAWTCRAHALWRRTLLRSGGQHSPHCPRPWEPMAWPSQVELNEARNYLTAVERLRVQREPHTGQAAVYDPWTALPRIQGFHTLGAGRGVQPFEIGFAPSTLDAAFYDAWTAMARRLGADPLDMARVAYAETGMNPRAFDPRSNAGGLIGFMPSILRGLGWTGTPEQFRELSAIEQIPYVERYYRPYVGMLRNDGLVYVANFLPSRLPRASVSDDSFVMTSRGDGTGYYDANRILDRDGNGAITVGDLRQHLAIQNVGSRYQAIESELRARGAGSGGGTSVLSAARSRISPLAIAALAASAVGLWYLYGTDEGSRIRRRGERSIDNAASRLAATIGL